MTPPDQEMQRKGAIPHSVVVWSKASRFVVGMRLQASVSIGTSNRKQSWMKLRSTLYGQPADAHSPTHECPTPWPLALLRGLAERGLTERQTLATLVTSIMKQAHALR